MKTRCQAVGFTIVELLVCIAIVALLIAILIPAIQRVREAANKLNCASNMRQLVIAVHNYESQFKRLPYGQIGPTGPSQPQPPPGQPYFGWGPTSKGWSWLVRILPFIEQDSLYVKGDVGSKTLEDSGICAMRIQSFLCPSDSAYYANARNNTGDLQGLNVGNTCYKGVSGSNWGWDGTQVRFFPTFHKKKGANGSYDGLNLGDGVFWRTDYQYRRRLTCIKDGLSNTFMIGEDTPEKNLWCSWPYASHAYGTCAIPPNYNHYPGGFDINPQDWSNNHSFRSSHPGGLQFGMADGSVRFIQNNISIEIYRALATISGHEPIAIPD